MKLPHVIHVQDHNIVIHSYNDQYKAYLYRVRKNAPDDHIVASDWKDTKREALKEVINHLIK